MLLPLLLNNLLTGGAGSQAITGALVSDGDTFYTATLTPGAVGITGALVTDGDTFYAATVGRGAVGITGALYADADTFYAATLTRGAVAISGALVTDGDTFYAATLSVGAVSVTGALVVDADTFYAATLTPGAVDITGALVVDADTFHAASVAQAGSTQNIDGELYANDNTFYGASIASATTSATTAGRRRSGTSYAYKTLTQLREEEKERLAALDRLARQKVKKAIRAGVLSDEAIAQATEGVLARVPEPGISREVLYAFISQLYDDVRQARAATQLRLLQIRAEQDEDDAEALLLAA